MSKCRSCGAEVFWAKSRTTGRTAPIDTVQSPEGNVILYDDGTYEVIGKVREPDDPPMRLNHFVTCPNREQHRK